MRNRTNAWDFSYAWDRYEVTLKSVGPHAQCVGQGNYVQITVAHIGHWFILFQNKFVNVKIFQFTTRIFTAKMRVVKIFQFTTRIFTAKMRVVKIFQLSTRIFAVKIRVVNGKILTTRIFAVKFRVAF